MTNNSAKFETLEPFWLLFCTGMWNHLHQNAKPWKQMCYRTENTLFCRRIRASFSPRNVTGWGRERVNRCLMQVTIIMISITLSITLHHYLLSSGEKDKIIHVQITGQFCSSCACEQHIKKSVWMKVCSYSYPKNQLLQSWCGDFYIWGQFYEKNEMGGRKKDISILLWTVWSGANIQPLATLTQVCISLKIAGRNHRILTPLLVTWLMNPTARYITLGPHGTLGDLNPTATKVFPAPCCYSGVPWNPLQPMRP